MWNVTGAFTNAAKITLGATAFIGVWGLYNLATFNNNPGGEINIDRSTDVGLLNSEGAFTNAAKITLGALATVGNFGLFNQTAFDNSTCESLIHIVSNSAIGDIGNFINAGMLIENASGNSSIGTNTGIVQNLNGGDFNIYNNTGLLSTSATDNIWTGCTGIDWATAANWSKRAVPLATDDVIIPAFPANSPTIAAATAAVAKSVEIQSGDTLTISALSSLTINGSKDFSNGRTLSFYNEGTVENSGRLILGNTSSIAESGLWNRSVFNNNPGAEINIDRSTNAGLYNQLGTFTNAAKITIGANTTVGANGLLNFAIFNNTSGAEINIDNAVTGLSNQGAGGLFTNASKMIIGATGVVGANGIENPSAATFDNSTCEAFIHIVSNSIISNDGNFFNAGTIIENATGNSSISTNTGVVQNLNEGVFDILTNTGTVSTSANDNIWTGCTGIDWATAANWSKGAVPLATDDVILPSVSLHQPAVFTAAVAQSVEVQSGDTLTIAAPGSLTINGSKRYAINAIDTLVGFYNNGAVENNGKLILGNNASVGTVGLYNLSLFHHNTGAEIKIDKASNSGLFNDMGATFVNSAKITIGASAPAGSHGLLNQSVFQNNACAELTLYSPLNNSNAFHNAGLFTLNTAQPHTNTELTNDGIIQYPQGNPIPNVINHDLILLPITTCASVTPALQIGDANSFTVGNTWYQDSTLTIIAGTYSPNTFTVTNLAGDSTYPLYFTASDPVNMCTRTVAITATVKAIPTVTLVSSNPSCIGDSAVFVVNGTNGATLTYTLTGLMGNQNLVLNGLNQNITSQNATADIILTLVSVAGVNECSQTLAVKDTVFVLAPPTPTNPLGDTISTGQSTTLTAMGCTGEGLSLLWYKSADNSLVTMPVSPTATTNYYARCQQTLGATSCLSDKTAEVTVVVEKIIFVNVANNNVMQDGTSWNTAFASLQAALTDARNTNYYPIEIRVAQGTYKPGTLRKDVFEIPSGVKMYGGFVGNENSLSQRDWKTHLTILSGEIGSSALNDNTHHVVLFRATNDSTRLDGFQIRRGYAEFFDGNQNTNLNDPNILTSGGGILAIDKSKGLITHCTLTDNRASGGGGILLRDSSNLHITQSIIYGNEANFGGGVYVLGGSQPYFENVLIANNKGLGGGLYVNKSQPTIINCTIASNKDGGNNAGGIFNTNASTTVKNSILWGNSPTQSTAGSSITYSIVEGGYAGTGNKNQNPLFVNPNATGLAPLGTLGDYHLQNCSLAINGGDNTGAPFVDLEGNARPYPVGLGIVDMGVFESQSSGSSGPNNLSVTENITSGTVLKTAGKITATNQVSNATVVYQATKSVILSPGFTATTGAGNSFLALIGGCETGMVPTGEAQK